MEVLGEWEEKVTEEVTTAQASESAEALSLMDSQENEEEANEEMSKPMTVR